ncbi:tRNA pseudouridine synthase A [Moraxella macacae 0408225]|uniref:tRNA pseudouridine synthase A n=1 Tax=Moraxella macacae 0408225 TaxID=1230338 RepID=L2F6W4_9GAMM|nr:tRNA pseudouridine(38-40) synthase TruA [Moraxella macacae]ELA08819.1 tRNA pseudouridine synthase A [Moraxella macacae 0408225]
MPKTYAINLEFIGTHYRGWQRQQHDHTTIQQTLETAFSKVANEPIEIIASGRTDAGVHASNMIAHFCTNANRDPYNWLRGVNALLPNDIALRAVTPMSDEFHARFLAIARRYRYVTLNQTFRPAILHGQVTHVHTPLNLEKMQQACQFLVGMHNFTSFRASQCQSKQPIRHVHFANLIAHGDFIVLDIQADGFLHHMVRNIMGSLFSIGRGEHTPDWINDLILAEDRTLAAPTAPADGLYFVNALYPTHLQQTLPKIRLSPVWLNLTE